ncbi:hypothetical protein IKG02_03240 [Candidatus Saccharibacteria bacterium]|nr:hypothetical protein [Candidatus Saccharibacteria bacterium]
MPSKTEQFEFIDIEDGVKKQKQTPIDIKKARKIINQIQDSIIDYVKEPGLR